MVLYLACICFTLCDRPLALWTPRALARESANERSDLFASACRRCDFRNSVMNKTDYKQFSRKKVNC